MDQYKEKNSIKAMTFDLRIISVAEKDITEIVLWYEKKLNGLGRRFITSLDTTLQSIQSNPKI